MEFLEALQQKAANIATLKITTVVGEAVADNNDPGSYLPKDG